MKARDVVRQCFNSLVTGDLAAFKKTADAPFLMAAEPIYQTRDDLDRYFNEQPMGLRNGGFYPLVMGTLPLEEYTKNATEDEKKFANKHRNDAVVILVQQGQYGAPNPTPDPTQGMLFLVRVTGDHPHVVGVSPGRSQIKYVW
jgi:hypothetical protein